MWFVNMKVLEDFFENMTLHSLDLDFGKFGEV